MTGLWKGKLEMLYRRDGVREWLSLYPELINDEMLRLVDFLEEHDDFDAYQALDLTRVCELPPQLSIYQCFVDLYLSSDKADWIDSCLQNCPRQQRVNVVTFAKVVRLLIELQWDEIFRKHRK